MLKTIAWIAFLGGFFFAVWTYMAAFSEGRISPSEYINGALFFCAWNCIFCLALLYKNNQQEETDSLN